MYERLDACPLCNHNEFTNRLVVKDHALSKESFVIVECDNCRFHFTNPRPSSENIHIYYDSSDYVSHSGSIKSLMELAYNVARYFTLRQKLKWINKFKGKSSTLLDYGCGVGSFLSVARKGNWSVQGVEPNPKARDIAISKNLTVHETLADLANNSFEVITLWHVLEHVPNINEVLSSLRKLLKPKGHIILALPNHQSYDANHYGEYWAGYDVPRHLYHFSIDNIVKLSKRHNLKLIETKPMLLDAYYVSLLSEKYRKGSPINALSTAYHSNKNANQTNYSSLTYILKK